MKKLIVAITSAVLLFCCAFAVYAVNCDFIFHVEAGGPSDYSYLTQKNGGSNYENKWYVTPKSSNNGTTSNWVSGETCRFRVRDSSRNAASHLYSKTQGSGSNSLYDKTFNHPYSITSQGGAYYYLYADKPASDPYSELRLVGTWCP